MNRAGLFALFCVLLLAACASTPTASTIPALPSEAQAIINSPQYAHGYWSWDVVELGSGKTLFASSENRLNFLGSTTKLFTVGTYYEEFGADSTLETPVYATGTRSGGSLTGDLVLVGSGDFILGGRGVLDGQLQYTEPDHVYAYAIPTVKPVAANPLAGLDKLAAEVKAAGITSINGDVLVDDRLWNPFTTKELPNPCGDANPHQDEYAQDRYKDAQSESFLVLAPAAEGDEPRQSGPDDRTHG